MFYVDNDLKTCKKTKAYFVNAGFITYYYTNPYDCLQKLNIKDCDLLITEYNLSEMDGIELLKEAKMLLPWLPIIITSEVGNIPLAVSAIKEGAVDFHEKPLINDIFINKIRFILEKHYENFSSVLNSLTKMEKRVFAFIIQGKDNKEISASLNRSKRTIENHRAHLMKKLDSHNIAELLKNATQTGLINFSKQPKTSE
ncbi:MAG: response regulator [Sedimentisphaerales bacterium]|nr:response regulator [Sedimentisphaerales bacterium]